MVAALAVVAILYALGWAPKLGCLLRMRVELPVWLLMAIALVEAGLWLTYRTLRARRRARKSATFDKLVRDLDAR
jgi:hypothetical protein